MITKKTYNIKDTVWIHGVNNTAQLTKGRVISTVDLTSAGYDADHVHYVVAVTTEMTDLLEIRTWETMSQDSSGPVGSIRDAVDEKYQPAMHKKAQQLGYQYVSDAAAVEDFTEPTPDEIHAAMARSEQAIAHTPLIIKKAKVARKYPVKKSTP